VIFPKFISALRRLSNSKLHTKVQFNDSHIGVKFQVSSVIIKRREDVRNFKEHSLGRGFVPTNKVVVFGGNLLGWRWGRSSSSNGKENRFF